MGFKPNTVFVKQKHGYTFREPEDVVPESLYDFQMRKNILQARRKMPKRQFIEEKLWAEQEDDNFGEYKKEIETVGIIKFPYNGKIR
jgi:hypothetical protein